MVIKFLWPKIYLHPVNYAIRVVVHSYAGVINTAMPCIAADVLVCVAAEYHGHGFRVFHFSMLLKYL